MKISRYTWFIVSLVIIAFNSGCNQRSKKETPITSNIEENDPGFQSADLLYEKLMASFSDDWIERESDPDLYPTFFGGSFVDDDGVFVVAVTENVGEHKKQLEETLGTANFKVVAVQYSYRQMMRVMDDIDNFIAKLNGDEGHPLFSVFAGAYPDVTQNRVKVVLSKVDDKTVNLFKKEVASSPLIIFEKGEAPDTF